MLADGGATAWTSSTESATSVRISEKAGSRSGSVAEVSTAWSIVTKSAGVAVSAREV